jgi:hypothetical protein
MTWFNNGLDLGNLAGSTSVTVPLLAAGIIPEGYIAGMTILRLILKIMYSAGTGAALVNALAAFYVGTRGSAATPPDLNADLANYYYFVGLQAPVTITSAINPIVVEKDIRTKRLIRGEDTDLFFRVTNNEVTTMQVGMECRMLLAMR